VWTFSFLCQEVILAWLRLRSGSIWTASLAHAGNNMVLSLLTGALLTGAHGLGQTAVTALAIGPLGAVCAAIVLTREFHRPEPATDSAPSDTGPASSLKTAGAVRPARRRSE
jgi:hypothetical protein